MPSRKTPMCNRTAGFSFNTGGAKWLGSIFDMSLTVTGRVGGPTKPLFLSKNFCMPLPGWINTPASAIRPSSWSFWYACSWTLITDPATAAFYLSTNFVAYILRETIPEGVFLLFSALRKSKNACPLHSANEKPNRTEPIFVLFFHEPNRTEPRTGNQPVPGKRNRTEPNRPHHV